MKKSKASVSIAVAVSIVLAGAIGIASASHDKIVLKDKDGNPILAADKTAGAPYSTEKTCGACHDYTERSAGFHVQQGANEYNKALDDGNDYSVSGRAFVYSPGMVGKW